MLPHVRPEDNEPLDRRHPPGAGTPAGVRSLLEGLAVTALSVFMLLGGFLLSRLDAPAVVPSPAAPTAALLPSPTTAPPTLTPAPSVTPSTSPSPTPPGTATPTATPTAAGERPPTRTPTRYPSVAPTTVPVCQHPAGWVPYIVQQGDTLAGLASRSGTTTYALMQANCLSVSTIYPGQTLYLPTALYVTPTRTPTPGCGLPPGWVVYYVVRGDTLYSLARRTNTTVDAIKAANCLSSNALYVGQALYLPTTPPTTTPSPSPTATAGPTATPTATATPSATPTATATPTDTPMPSLTPTGELSPTLSLSN